MCVVAVTRELVSARGGPSERDCAVLTCEWMFSSADTWAVAGSGVDYM